MKKMWPSLSLKHCRRWFFIIYPRDFVNDFVRFLLIFCVFWPYKHALWLNTVVLIEGGFPSMSRGSITWGAGVLATLLIQYKTPKKTPILFSFGGQAVIYYWSKDNWSKDQSTNLLDERMNRLTSWQVHCQVNLQMSGWMGQQMGWQTGQQMGL